MKTTIVAITVVLIAVTAGGFASTAHAKKCTEKVLNACTAKCTVGTSQQKSICQSECLIQCSKGIN